MEPFIKINGRPFPYPKRGLELITTTFVDSARNTSGRVVGQKVGRDQFKINKCEWPALSADQWTVMLSLLDEFFVTVTFPDQTTGAWRTLTMYPGDRSAEPYWLDEETGLPRMYINCRVNLIDAGYEDTSPPPVPAQYRLQTKIAVPTKNRQIVKPDSPGYYGLSEVEIAPVPAETVDTSTGTVLPGDILSGKRAFSAGKLVTGTMPNHGTVNESIDGINRMSYTVPKGYVAGGRVTLSNDIEKRLSKI